MPTEEELDSTISDVEALRQQVAEAESEGEAAVAERTRAIKMERAEAEKRALKARLERAQVAKNKREGRAPTASSPEDQTREELYERAQELDVEGRSDMDKDELQTAVTAAERSRSTTSRPTTPTGTETKNKE